MSWFLNPALTRFRNEVNAKWPRRDKTSDGTIGDAAHQSRSSDHNPDPDGSVDAWDMDVDGPDIAACKRAFEAHEASSYWIHNDQISFRDEGWRPRSYAYAGPSRNKHQKHCHWNSRQSYENSTKPWFPVQEAPDVIEDSKHGQVVMYRLEALVKGADKVSGGPTKGEPVWMVSATKAVAAALGQVDEAVGAQLAGKLAALDSAVAAARTEIADVDDQVLAQIGSADSAQEQADLLRAVLGDRAREVGALLAQS